jgi:hypothetical protein
MNPMNPQTGKMHLLDRTLIESALAKSPSGGNSKPFEWRWRGDSLQITHVESLAVHYLNRNHHTSWIALGCLLTSVEVAANVQGFEMRFLVSEQDLCAELRFQPGKGLRRLNRLQALTTRTTYRGPLTASQKPLITVEDMASNVHVSIRAAEEISNEMKSFLTKADSYLWLQTAATRDFFREVRFGKKSEHPDGRGIRVTDLGIGKADQIMLRCFSYMPWLPSIIARIPVLNASFRASTRRSLKHAHLLLISVDHLQPASLLKVGQESMKVWLDLEEQGYKVQPYSMASITLVDAATGFLPMDTKAGFRRLFSRVGPEVLRRQFNLPSAQKPVWLLRVGKIS